MRYSILSLLIVLLSALNLDAASSASPIRFTDVTQTSGVSFVHTDGSEGNRYIVESVASGLATFDYDGDGNIDILFLNGSSMNEKSDTRVSRNALYRNKGDWKFEDKTEVSGLIDSGFHLGTCIGDYNNDGFPDVFLSNFGPDILYRNNGDGTFTDVTDEAGVGNGNEVGAGAAFLDIEGDGDLDLFVANYCDFQISKHQARRVNGHPAYSGPAIYGPRPDTLFRNEGNGTFKNISGEAGIAAIPGTGMGVVCADYDNDGDTDIIVGNDAMANFVWRNEGNGRFKEMGLFSGLAYDQNGIGLGTMGVDCADYDNDGKLDFFMTSYEKQWAILYRNEGNGFFSDVTQLTGAGTASFSDVTWGTGIADFDNDGFRDLFIACGHLQDNIGLWDDTKGYEAQNILLWNSKGKKFIDYSERSGDGLSVKESSRGAAFDDLDNDGDLDAVILNARRRPTILRNDSSNENHWIRIRLQSELGNRDGIGARIHVVAGELTLTDEVRSGRGYQSHYGTYPHFGLGQQVHIDRIEVRWSDGSIQVVKDVSTKQLLTIRQGRSSP